MAAGIELTQKGLDQIISGWLRQANRLKAEVAHTKAVVDTMDTAALQALPLGGRTVSWSETDVANLISALNDLNTALTGWSTTFAGRVWGAQL